MMNTPKFILSIFFISTLVVFALPQQTISKDTFITLYRGFCYGTCPSYKLKISADGTVEFEPKSLDREHKVVSGKRIKSKISQDKLKQIILEFEKINYFSLENEYGNTDYIPDKNCPEIATDNPTVVTSITLNGKSKEISHYHGCRGSEVLEKLTKLEDKIDETVNTKRWVK